MIIIVQKKENIKDSISDSKKTLLAIVLIVIVAIISLFFLGIYAFYNNVSPNNMPVNGNVLLIPIDGPIVVGNGLSFLSSDMVSSTKIVEQIKQAEKDRSVDAILFEINSPGGSAVASDEIGQAIKDFRKKN